MKSFIGVLITQIRSENKDYSLSGSSIITVCLTTQNALINTNFMPIHASSESWKVASQKYTETDFRYYKNNSLCSMDKSGVLLIHHKKTQHYNIEGAAWKNPPESNHKSDSWVTPSWAWWYTFFTSKRYPKWYLFVY